MILYKANESQFPVSSYPTPPGNKCWPNNSLFWRKCWFLTHFNIKINHGGFKYMWHDQGEWVGCREYSFWVTGLKIWQILMFFIVFKLQRMFISAQPGVRLKWGLDQNVAFWMDKWLMLKTQNWILPTCDSFPLIVSHIIHLFLLIFRVFFLH